MGKFLIYLCAVLIIFLGIPNMAYCIGYIFDRTDVNGSPNQLEKNEFSGEYGYSIKYNLDDGLLSKENPDKYGLFTADFTLNNPTKDGYEFIGWTGSNGENPQLRVTIRTGSSGNLEFTANFALMLETPEISIEGSMLYWNEVEYATEYIVNINGVDYHTTNETKWNLLQSKLYLFDGYNVIKVKANAFVNSNSYYSSEYSNSVNYSVIQLDKPIINIDEFNISWDSINNAEKYLVIIGGNEVITENTSINLLNYQTYISQSGMTAIRVKALANDYSEYISSAYSDIKYFTTPTLNVVNLSIQDSTLSWDYNENVEYYELYLNGTLKKKIYGLNQIDTLLFASDMQNGNNGFYLKAYAPGYKSSISNTITYNYVNVADLENLVLEADFYRTSDTFKLDSRYYLDYIQSNWISFYTNGTFNRFDSYEPMGPDSSEFDNNGCIQVLNYLLDFDRTLYSMRFVGSDPVKSMFEILSIINDNYVVGKLTATINLSGLIKFKIKANGTYYTPNNITIKIHYKDMYTNSVFKENCVNDLSDFSSNYTFSTTYNIVSGTTKVDYKSITIKLEKTDGTSFLVGYSTHKNYGGYTYNQDSITKNDLINLTANNKYKLSNGFYFTVDIITLLDSIIADADSRILDCISSPSWNGELLANLNLNDLISVKYEDGTHVGFNYDISLKYNIFTLY